MHVARGHSRSQVEDRICNIIRSEAICLGHSDQNRATEVSTDYHLVVIWITWQERYWTLHFVWKDNCWGGGSNPTVMPSVIGAESGDEMDDPSIIRGKVFDAVKQLFSGRWMTFFSSSWRLWMLYDCPGWHISATLLVGLGEYLWIDRLGWYSWRPE